MTVHYCHDIVQLIEGVGMPELARNYIKTNTLQERARSLRTNEVLNRCLGGVAVVSAGVDVLACAFAHHMSSTAIGIEAGSLWMAYYATSLATSYGRRADVIDAELLQRQRPPQPSSEALEQ